MTMPLTPDEMHRYSRQIMLNHIGIDGQLKIKSAKVLCIGAGGLGSPLLLYLAAAGVGTLGIVDHDRVELSNLQRQILFHDQHIGAQKVLAVQQQLAASNPHIHVIAHQEKFSPLNAADLINQYDIVADCSDNFATRYLINDLCFQLSKPFVLASVSQTAGQCSTFSGNQGPCFRCLFPHSPQAGFIQNCEEGGVLGMLPGLFGIIQATEIIKWILQAGDLLIGRVLSIDLMTMRFREFQLPQNPDCDLCVHYRMMTPMQEQQTCVETTNMNEYLIFPHELKELLKLNKDIQLIDVRTKEKHDAFNIGGKLIPSGELSNRLQELDPNKMTVTYCSMGGSSMRALQFLISAGFKNVKSLDGGVTRWQEENL